MRTKLSLYLDDTHYQPDGALGPFVAFVAAHGLAGKVSVIMRYGEFADLARDAAAQRQYIDSLRELRNLDFDFHMEFFTHGRLWDFSGNCLDEAAPHESIWVYEPQVTKETYQAYFENIVREAAHIGIKFGGVSFPGCDCPKCSKRWKELNAVGIRDVNPAAWQALLAIAEKRGFGVSAVPCFVDVPNGMTNPRIVAMDLNSAIYDLRPDLDGEDRLGFDGIADPDFYISESGRSGGIVDVVRAGWPRCVFNAHWQGMNPVSGPGWNAFKEVVSRVHRHLGADIEWASPSSIVAELWKRERYRIRATDAT